jgi:hypothetical protein
MVLVWFDPAEIGDFQGEYLSAEKLKAVFPVHGVSVKRLLLVGGRTAA